jgi:acetoin utilization deacetylase AcuC-like enzyme
MKTMVRTEHGSNPNTSLAFPDVTFFRFMIPTVTPCPKDIIALVHDKAYLDKMEMKAAAIRPNEVPRHATLLSGNLALYEDQKDIPRDTYISAGSWHAAQLSAGAVCKAVDFVCGPERKSRNAFCAVRPPGHHAGVKGHAHANTQGYCIINNVAVGAKYAMHKYNVQRIAIVDFGSSSTFVLNS